MARLFTDGAEMQDLMFWDDISGLTIGTAAPAPFLGTAYYKLIYNQIPSKNLPAAISECYMRVRVYGHVLNTAMMFPYFRTGSTNVCWLTLDAANHWMASGTTVGVLATSTLTMLADTWYEVEVYFKEANAPNGRFEVYVDGNLALTFTGDTQPAAATTFDNIAFRAGTVLDVNSYLLIDDLAFNDTAGAADNSYPGDGIVVMVTPNGNGTHNNWHGSDGNDVDNYLLCDEFPKDDDTTYVYHDNTAATQQQFAMSHLSFTGYTILRLYAEARARKTAATAMTLKLGQLAAGGADVVSAGRNLYVGSYTRVVGDDSKVNPVDGNPWEEADIDAIEFVAQVT